MNFVNRQTINSTVILARQIAQSREYQLKAKYQKEHVEFLAKRSLSLQTEMYCRPFYARLHDIAHRMNKVWNTREWLKAQELIK